MDTVLEKVFPYEGIPELTLNFFSPEEKHYKGSFHIREQLEKKYKKVEGKKTFFNNKLHSYDDCTVQRTTNVQEWFLYGKFHRENDKPATIWPDGSEEWWVDGKLHREGDKPTVVSSISQKWYKDFFILHRDGDKPAVIHSDGTHEWWVDGKRHREGDKPAVTFLDGQQEWWVDGNRHREGKPAVIFTDGTQDEWWVDGDFQK